MLAEHLFDLVTAEIVTQQRRAESQVERGVIAIPPGQIGNLSNTLFSNLSKGGICTLVVTGRASWNPRDSYYESVRRASLRGCKIERVFLLPHRIFRNDASLKEHLELDEEAGIQTAVLDIGDLVSTLSLPQAHKLDFGIWDDSITCHAVYQRSGQSRGMLEWRISRRPEDIDLFRRIWHRIEDKGLPVRTNDENSDHEPRDLQEPMIRSAPLAGEIASVMCRGSYLPTGDCSWYHSIWQYLRIFDMVSTPTWHSEFYTRELSCALGEESGERVLVSGTADYSMLAHVLWAASLTETSPYVAVLDLCQTPLFLCQWYARLVGYEIHSVQKDILKFAPAEPFDLIVADAFLTRFSPEMRQRVLNKWGTLLDGGGKVVTTARIEPGARPRRIEAAEYEVSAFGDNARQAAERWESILQVHPEEMEAAARAYASQMNSQSFHSIDELKESFANAGFELIHLEEATVKGEMRSTRYARIVARCT